MQSQVRFNRVPEKVPENVWEALVQSQVRFNRVLEKVPEKVPGSLGAKPSQVQRVPEKVPAWLRSTLQKDLKKNVAAVGDSTEAYFWI